MRSLRVCFLAAALCGGFSGSAGAEAGRPPLIDVPSAPSAAQWSWPAERVFTLPSGLRGSVLVKADEALVAVSLFVPAGTLAETPTTRGAADLLVAWLRAGSAQRDAMPLELRVEELGADVEVQADRLGTTLSCKAMVPRMAGCLELISDLVQHPAFSQQRLQAARAQLATQVRQQLASDEGRARAHLNNLVFGDDHPVGQAVVPDDIGGLSEATLRTFWSTWYRPNLARLVVVGNVEPNVAQKAAAAAFQGWKKSSSAPRVLAARLPGRQGTRLLLVDQPSAREATVVFGQMLAPKSPKDLPALEALTFLFGGAGLGSRLALDVASKGLILAGGAGLEPAQEGRLLRTTLQAPPAKAWDALLAAVNQIKALQETGASIVELAELKARSAALDPFTLETGAGLAQSVAEAGSLAALKALAQGVVSLDQAALKGAAKLVNPDAFAVVVVGPAKLIAPQFEAAKLRFERISFEDPLSVTARARRRQVANASNAPEASQARGLIIKALAAAGGAPAWRALSTLQVRKKGQRHERGQIVTMVSTTAYRRPSNLRVDQEMLLKGRSVGKGTFIVSRDAVVGTGPTGVMGSLPEANVKSLQAAAFEDVVFLLLNALDAKPALPMAVKEPWVEKDIAYPGLELQVPSGAWLSLYFDPVTHLLSRIRSPDLAGAESEQRLSDWREVEGLKFPYKQVSLGANMSEATLEQVLVNPTLDDKLFQR